VISTYRRCAFPPLPCRPYLLELGVNLLKFFFLHGQQRCQDRIEPLGRIGYVKLVGFDASAPLVNDLKDGWIDSLVVQNPFQMGYEAVRAIALKLKGGAPNVETDTGVTLVRASDLDRPPIQELLSPDIRQYLTISH
jgi:hypothetical protein